MAFEGLTEKLQQVFHNLRRKGKLSEEDVREALKEIKIALLEADVNFKVVKEFSKTVQEQAIGQDVMNGLNPGQMVVKIVHDELVKLMGTEMVELRLKSDGTIPVFMMMGLQGAGKTTTTAKLAGIWKKKGKNPLLVACDIYRPAAIQQLQVNGEKQGVTVFSAGDKLAPHDIAKGALEYARKNGHDLVILDTAGRLHVDEQMMEELQQIQKAVPIQSSLLVVDAMTGQDAVNVAKTFDEKIGIDGIIVTKLDGDTRGGAALSIRAVTGKPILYVGMGEKLSDLEQFYPERMASRILGMGDIMSLIEKAEAQIDDETAKGMTERMKKAEFNLEDFLESMKQMRGIGGLSSIVGMLPGLGGAKLSGVNMEEAEQDMKRMEAIISSMTPKERRNPKLLNPSRKNRVAKGAGVDISEVNRLMKRYEQSRKMMKKLPGMLGGLGGRGGFKMPF